jgi:uncharacterized protein (TIGR03067 family)
MNRYGVLALAAGLMIAADKPSDDVQKQLKKFQGDWELISVEINGREVPAENLQGARVTFKGNKIINKIGNNTSEGTITIDPTKKPKQYNGTGKDQNGKETKSQGIYEIKGDTLRFCFSRGGGERPTKFSSKGGTQEKLRFLTVLKRVKKDK